MLKKLRVCRSKVPDLAARSRCTRARRDQQRAAFVKAIINTARKTRGEPPLSDAEIVLLGDRRKKEG
jgi:hypothetical protein